MATMSKPKPTPVEYHEYDVDAQLISGELRRPLVYKIGEQGFLSLEGESDHHFFQRAEPYSANGLISYRSGYTRVSGSYSQKHGWVTLAAAVVEGLNVLDVITADRIVAQVSTEHPPFDGHVPTVTFLGTRFENLQINGHLVKPTYNLDICGNKPADDGLYSEDHQFLDRVEQQSNEITGLSAPLGVQYHSDAEHLKNVRSFRGPYAKGYASTLKCSLVQSVPTVPKAKCAGNILQIPDFGSVALAVLEVQQAWTKDGGIQTVA